MVHKSAPASESPIDHLVRASLQLKIARFQELLDGDNRKIIIPRNFDQKPPLRAAYSQSIPFPLARY
jgi:hypothetical protein